jgi:predicted DNA-binding ribbon-helix-helix protein
MSELKIFNIRLEKELWTFLKKKAVDRETTLNEMMVEMIRKYKRKCEIKLTDQD